MGWDPRVNIEGEAIWASTLIYLYYILLPLINNWLINLFYVLGCFSYMPTMCLCITCVLYDHGCHKRALHSLGLVLQIVVNFHGGVGNWTRVIWKSIQFCQLMSYLSSPYLCFLTTASMWSNSYLFCLATLTLMDSAPKMWAKINVSFLMLLLLDILLQQ